MAALKPRNASSKTVTKPEDKPSGGVVLASSLDPKAWAVTMAAVAAQDEVLQEMLDLQVQATEIKYGQSILVAMRLEKDYGEKLWNGAFPEVDTVLSDPGGKTGKRISNNADYYDPPAGSNLRGKASRINDFADQMPDAMATLNELEQIKAAGKDTTPETNKYYGQNPDVIKKADKRYTARRDAYRSVIRTAILLTQQRQRAKETSLVISIPTTDLVPDTDEYNKWVDENVRTQKPITIMQHADPDKKIPFKYDVLSVDSFNAIDWSRVVAEGGNWDALLKVRTKKRTSADNTVIGGKQDQRVSTIKSVGELEEYMGEVAMYLTEKATFNKLINRLNSASDAEAKDLILNCGRVYYELDTLMKHIQKRYDAFSLDVQNAADAKVPDVA